ncbi:MAG: hypothetical protein GY903_11670 [Fuerstiella sp.]|nr:hypothetical protein [Fuerstiella sp.]MCP4855141.1 hypothetical protein [Fuerstiella sp.]
MNLFTHRTFGLALMLLLAGVAPHGVLSADDTFERDYLVADYTSRKVHLISPEGRIKSSYDARNANDVWILKDNSFLFNDGSGAKRIHPDGRIIWEYRSPLPPAKNEVHTCQLLDNGNVLIAENGPSRVIEVDPQGRVVKLTPIRSAIDNNHMRFRMCRKLDGGGFILAHAGEQFIREYDRDGNETRTVRAPEGISFEKVHAVVKLTNGNLLISSGKGQVVLEIDRQDRVAWKLDPQELLDSAGVEIRFICGLQRLSNGNTILAVYQGNYQVVEVNRQKQVVKKFNIDGVGVVTAIHVMEKTDLGLR